jgi:hypothetical protein
MPWQLPEETATGGPPCVLDVTLSLAASGLFWTIGLARVLPVWLPQCHWAIVDDAAFLFDDRLLQSLAGVADCAQASARLVRVREDWREAREEMCLESFPRLYWPGDGRAYSAMPKDNDGIFVDRYHVLAAGLDGRRAGSVEGLRDAAPGSANTLADCARDTLALAVALADRRSLILCLFGDGDPAPPLCQHIVSAGIDCHRLTDPTLIEPLRASLLPALFASGLAVSLASGKVRLAGISIAAPGALAAASLAAQVVADDDNLELDAGADQGEAALWDGASAMWWELP